MVRQQRPNSVSQGTISTSPLSEPAAPTSGHAAAAAAAAAESAAAVAAAASQCVVLLLLLLLLPASSIAAVRCSCKTIAAMAQPATPPFQLSPHPPHAVLPPWQSPPGHGVKLLVRLPCVQKVQVSIPARRMVPFFGAMALSLSVLLSGLCPCGASVRGRGFGHFASTKCHPV